MEKQMSGLMRRPSKLQNRSGLVRVAALFKERAKALGYEGKMRDDAALEYFHGAAAAALISGRTGLHDKLASYAQYSITSRGYLSVDELTVQAEVRATLTGKASEPEDHERPWRLSGGAS
jgi:hypothetical protein